MIEVELKLEIHPDSWPRIEERLATMQLKRRLRNSDTYYDTMGFDLLRQAVFVRVRNQERLEFKFNKQAAPEHLHCTERVFSQAPEAQQAEEMNSLFSQFLPQWKRADTVGEALHQNGLIELARIENRRIEYTLENLVVCVDRIGDLGDFLEIEIQCEEGSDTDRALAQVKHVAAGFTERQVHIGYVELWLQKYQPHAYRKGKYQEERSFCTIER